MCRSALERAAEHWGQALGVDPPVVVQDGVVLLPSDGDIAVLALGRGCVVTAPVEIHERLAAVPRHVLTDVQELARSFADLGGRPFQEIGTAVLCYLERDDFVKPALPHPVRAAGAPGRSGAVLAQCAADDIDEAAVGQDEGVVVALTPYGKPAALAAVEFWGSTIGHLGVLTVPAYRGPGYGTAAAARASRDVLARGLLPPWRAALGHTPSLSIARRWGFVELGRQSLVLLARPALAKRLG